MYVAESHWFLQNGTGTFQPISDFIEILAAKFQSTQNSIQNISIEDGNCLVTNLLVLIHLIRLIKISFN